MASGSLEVMAVRSVRRPVAIISRGRKCYIVDKHDALPGFTNKAYDDDIVLD